MARRYNIEIVIEQEPLPAAHDTVIAVKKAALPLTFNVEFGAYVNAIRSSLDILATSRYGACKPEDAYFPIARDEASYRAKEFVKGLPPTERAIIESLEPYAGGNPLLIELNQLDVLRKHRRLIEEVIFPDRREDKTLLGRIRKDAAGRKLKFTPEVALREPRSASGKEVATALS